MMALEQGFEGVLGRVTQELQKQKPDILGVSLDIGYIWEASGLSENEIAQRIGINENLIPSMLTVADKVNDIISGLHKEHKDWD